MRMLHLLLLEENPPVNFRKRIMPMNHECIQHLWTSSTSLNSRTALRDKSML
jgi:hypothetical protein